MIERSLTCIIIALVLAFSTGKPIIVIDKTDLREQTHMNPPAMSAIGSTGSGAPASRFTLPLRLNAVDAQISLDGNFIATVKLTNISDSTLKIPISLDQVSAYRSGNLNRKAFAISSLLASDENLPDIKKRQTIVVLFGSDSFRGSLLTLAPNTSVSLRVGLPSKAVQLHVGDRVYLSGEMTTLSNKSYSVESSSDVVASANAIRVTGPL